MKKVSATQQTNGGTQQPAEPDKITVTGKEYAELYLCYESLPGSTIQKNIGTAVHENFVNRAWLSSHIGIFHRNARKLRSHAEELIEKQKAFTKQREKFVQQVAEAKNDVTRLKDIHGQVEQLMKSFNESMEEKAELPPLELIPEETIKDWEILNQFIGSFWKYGVQFSNTGE